VVVRLSAAICSAAIMFAVSTAAMARTEALVRSNAADEAIKGATIVGAASEYNPFRPGYRSGGPDTASGEHYDASAWAAAIQIDLRKKFGGVRGDTRPRYALVEAAGKRAIVKINDVGPLKPGRVIDFDEHTMRYFDPTLRLGVIQNVRVTPLPDGNWAPGPIAEQRPNDGNASG